MNNDMVLLNWNLAFNNCNELEHHKSIQSLPNSIRLTL